MIYHNIVLSSLSGRFHTPTTQAELFLSFLVTAVPLLALLTLLSNLSVFGLTE